VIKLFEPSQGTLQVKAHHKSMKEEKDLKKAKLSRAKAVSEFGEQYILQQSVYVYLLSAYSNANNHTRERSDVGFGILEKK
jgi:hypothetical protein